VGDASDAVDGAARSEAGPPTDAQAPREGSVSGPDAGSRDAAAGDAAATGRIVSRLFTSGSRLKAQWLVAADGAEQFAGWHDTLLGEDCSFAVAADGRPRCLPSGPTVGAQGVVGIGVLPIFADASCTQPAYWGPSSCTSAPTTIAVADPTACVVRTHVLSAGAQVTTAYSNTSGTCSPIGFTGSLYLGGAEVAASAFVGATLSSRPAAGGVIENDLTGDDGSLGFQSFTDATTGLFCQFALGTDSQYHCLPDLDSNVGVDTGAFADSTCSSPAFSFLASCPAPTVGTSTQLPSCVPSLTEVVHLDTTLVTALYTNENPSSTCSATSAQAGIEYLTGGVAYAPSAFGSATLMAASGATRLSEYDYVTPAGLVQAVPTGSDPSFPPTPTFHDTSLNLDCDLETASDGQVRCLPWNVAQTVGGNGYFSDSACTQPVLWGGSCGTPAYGLIDDTSTCPPMEKVVTVAPFSSTAMAYSNSSAGCVGIGVLGSGLYVPVATVAPSTFEPMTKVVR
jgi:hypothetical protein